MGFLTAALVAPGATLDARATQFNISTSDDAPADCSAIQVSSREYETAAAEETLSVGSGPLQVSPGGNGGVWITGTTDQVFSVRACKFAMGRDEADAESKLSAIQIENTGGHLTARGPSGRQWTVFFIVGAPRGATIAAETNNGPISVRGVDASLTARATNGPIAIRDSRGQLDARTQNGPISIEDTGGDVKVAAENGPLTVRLGGAEWAGEGLEGETSNGPLSLSVPSGYRSGVVVEADGRSPFTCRRCDEAQRTWDDDSRRVQFGSGPARVRLKTVNGPVTVKN
jgi:hypothetical protein